MAPARCKKNMINEKTFRGHVWVLCLEWEQNPDWTESEYLWTPWEVEYSLEMRQDERDLGIIKKTIYRDSQVWHTVQAKDLQVSLCRTKKEEPMCPAFRVWDNHLHCFVDDPGFAIGLDGTLRLGSQECSPDRYIVEQCVAVDKRGTPTYIGDIIACEFTWWGHPMCERHHVRFGTDWYVLPFHTSFFVGERKLWIEVLRKKFEVIGNVHQHPDLIEKESLIG